MTLLKTTDKWSCRAIVQALEAFGVRHAVTSPGSRNAPLLMALARGGMQHVHSVIDERSAAFIALGMASVSGEPVAIVCTSGTALLNYAPAVAEAYYRHLPLVVISADRPASRIDQDDSQTIRQPGALSNITLGSYNITGEAETDEERWLVNRTLNDALLTATRGRRGPVHINVHLSVPLTGECKCEGEKFRRIDIVESSEKISTETARSLAAEMAGRRVLVVGGFSAPSGDTNRGLATLASIPSAAVLCEGTANVHARGCMNFADADIRPLNDDAMRYGGGLFLRPDILITFGGSLVSAQMKRYLRDVRPAEHWHVGRNDATIDCYFSLTRRIEIAPENFFPRVANALAHLSRTSPKADSCTTAGYSAEGYGAAWRDYLTPLQQERAARQLPWSGMKAVETLIGSLPRGWNLQLSNGMTVRQALACNLTEVHRTDCNRGVSGIDGSVSTALGASLMSTLPTLLITGDMSMQYDLAALSSTLLTPRLRIAVVSNGGGGIFHYVKGTAQLPEMPTLLNGTLKLPLEKLAEAYGIAYARATDEASLRKAMKLLYSPSERPVIVEIITDADTDATLL